SDFAGLVKYITDEQAKNQRVGYVAVTNCHTDRPEVAITEVLNTQAQNTRSGADKTYHLIVSFRPGEQPDDATLKAIEARICEGLGFGEHQRVSAVHHDTDNLHIHIAINKIHPTRYTILEPFNAYHTLGQLCEKLEREYGLERDNHQGNKLVSEGRAQDMERHAGVESLQGWVKRECAADMQAAQSWEALHQVMRDNGLELRERGNGFVIQAADGLAVKASSIGREFSKAKLEERLGTFEPSAEHLERAAQKPRKQYDKKPVRSRVNTVELHAKYKADQLNISGSRTAEW
ncbi:TraI/MobA(P) family conjugative relaxase, partial [Pseudomonas aeruginosa]|uniref:TraI/MobA(P) family conjugative relaxase n=1 Tax=Pseudomonas aeruginosa TaxID=287 RepID=UPI000AA3B6F4